MATKLKTIDAFVKEHGGNIAAANRALGSNYITFFRWLNREIISPENSAWRKEAARLGVELPGLTYK